MTMIEAKNLVWYMLSKLGCTHPFKLSRLLALAEIESIKRTGKRLTCLKYVEGPGTFYIEGLKELFDDPCFRKREGDPSKGVRGCVEYICDPPRIPSEAEEIVNAIIERYSGVGDLELNSIVVNDSLFKRLVRGEQACS
jgi:hydroxypyruvate isomerase